MVAPWNALVASSMESAKFPSAPSTQWMHWGLLAIHWMLADGNLALSMELADDELHGKRAEAQCCKPLHVARCGNY